MNRSSTPSPQPSPDADGLFGVRAAWQQLKRKQVAYLTLPLLVMATITEFVILATGFKYQQTVCLPQGMGVTFFGIGPIGATILAVELLKLPLAIWTASRTGWTKAFMLFAGLPLICVLTFQLVKDMAVYEMGVALKPASEFLEQAAAQEVKITQLGGNLEFIEAKRAERDRKLTEFAARKAKAKADFEELVKRNEETRQDAISLTDYQKKELADMEIRQSTMIRQFDADAAGINKAIADLRAQREAELARATKWNAEEARIENAYKQKLAQYTNKKAAYDKDKAEYDGANVLKRQLLKEPVDPGVPPEREANTVLKPTLIADLEAQIKAKEAELATINSKRREGVSQVAADARRLRDQFDQRSTTKRAETDKKREELSAAQAALTAQWLAEEKEIEREYAAAVQKTEGIRAELDAARKSAEQFYEQREAALRNTQVHRIATTVEIVRGLIFGERPVSITATAKERGDRLTDQISMVRVWVYPVLAFIVAFLPTLMVEIGFSTMFKPEQQRPPHRLGFLGRRMHALYTRAGRLKVLRAERLATEAAGEITLRDQALAAVKADADRALAQRDAELKSARADAAAAAARHDEVLRKKETEWVAKLSDMADALNRAVVEQDALRDLQKTEVERQVQLRQNAWSERLGRLSHELEAQRAAGEAERTALLHEHHQKQLELTEDCKAQVIAARRRATDAELAAVEQTTRLAHELKEAQQARDLAEAQLRQQSDSLTLRLTQAQDEAARELEKAARAEQQRAEKQQADFERALRQRDEEFARRLGQREQELTLAFEARLADEQSKAAQAGRLRAAELEREAETRARELEARWQREAQARDAAAQARATQREQQLAAQADERLRAVQAQAEEQARRREQEFKRQLDAQAREAEARFREAAQQTELASLAKLKQREQELAAAAAAREAELQTQWAADVRARQEESERQAESRVRAAEARLGQEARQREEVFAARLRQREQQLQAQFDARQTEWQAQAAQEARRRDAEAAEARQREQDLIARLAAQAQAHEQADRDWKRELEIARAAVEPIKSLLARTEQERDEAKEFAAEGYRQVQNLEKKLGEASAFLNDLKTGNGKTIAGVRS